LYMAIQTLSSVLSDPAFPPSKRTTCSPLSGKCEEAHKAAVCLLLEDALKMPFTVFQSKHKQQILKVYQKYSSSEDKDAMGGGGEGDDAEREWLLLMDLDENGDGTAMLEETGDTFVVSAVGLPASKLADLQAALAAEEDVEVCLKESSNRGKSKGKSKPIAQFRIAGEDQDYT